MSRRVQTVLFVAGAAVLTLLVWRIGPATLLEDAVRTGWMFLVVLAVYGVAYLANSWAWHLILADVGPRHPPFLRAFTSTVSGFSLNFITPLVNLGGEPFKAAAVAPWIGSRRAAGAVVLYQMLHTLAILLTYELVLAVAAIVLPFRVWLDALMATAFVVVGGLTWILFTAHRQGALERILDALHRIPLLSRMAPRIEPWRRTLVAMDQQVVDFYHRGRERFVFALALECVARCLVLLEFWLIVRSVGVQAPVLSVFAVSGLESLIGKVLFLFPYELGPREGSMYVLFPLIGLSPSLGVYTALVSRVRDLTWIACGVFLVWLSGERPDTDRQTDPTPVIP
jgi:uncharacterized protein (TIRG00374 family)